MKKNSKKPTQLSKKELFMWENGTLIAFAIWPAVIVGSALINMLISWTFSWSELIIDYMIGVVIGITFYYGTVGEVTGVEHFFLTVSTGIFGLLKWVEVEKLREPETLFLVCAVATVGSVLLTAALDRGAAALKNPESPGGVILSILIFPMKAPFALITSLLGLILGGIGMIAMAIRKSSASPGAVTKGGVAFIGGTIFFDWGLSGRHATTFGSVVNVFKGRTAKVIEHELYHSRQYIYLRDWLGVFYFTIAGIWGIVSSAIAAATGKNPSFQTAHFFRADSSKEVGNPLERAAYNNWP